MTETENRVRANFRAQAEACEHLGSPFNATLCRVVADMPDRSTAVGAAVWGWPGNPRDDALALRFCGALHALVLSGLDPELAAVYPPSTPDAAALARAIPAVLARHEAFILGFMDSAPQTNEIARSGMLLPGFLTIARETGLPLELFEIGASAGLNMLFDRFRYRYGEDEWGDPHSPVPLAPEVRGAAVPLGGTLKVGSRKACDRTPIHVADAADRLRLRSYVWPDQTARLERLDAAIGLAMQEGAAPERADAADFVSGALAIRREGVTRVLFHSIMWHYMPDLTRRAVEVAIRARAAEAGRSSPFAWLRMEPIDTGQPHAMLSLDLWPRNETCHLARCDYHGRWIEWLAR